MSFREINIRLPWLKVVLLITVMILSALGMLVALERHAREEPPMTNQANMAEETNDGTVEADTPEVKSTAELAETATEKETAPKERDLTGKKLVVITFDDGPSDETTPTLLKILEEKQVTADFFVVGIMMERYPALFDAEVKAGHEIGSHTATHANLARSTIEAIKWENARMEELFRRHNQPKPTLMRPPYGAVTNNVRTYTEQPLILWSVDPEDWKYRDAAEIAKRVRQTVFDGAIILLHDIYPSTIEAVPRMIDELRADGYEFVTVTELAELRQTKLEKAWTYGAIRP